MSEEVQSYYLEEMNSTINVEPSTQISKEELYEIYNKFSDNDEMKIIKEYLGDFEPAKSVVEEPKAVVEEPQIEEKEQENNVFIDNLGRLNIKEQEIYVDAEGNTKVFDFQLTKPQNLQLYQKTYLNLVANNDYFTFASVLLPKMVEFPKEARKIEFFENDSEALVELCEVIATFMEKSKEKKKRKLNMKLK